MYVHTGSIPLMPLSYNTMRSHVFRGTLPGNGGCANGPSVDGQVTIDCGLGTALIDCDSDLNQTVFDNLSDTPLFMWNKTALSSNEVPIIFKFDQQVNVAIIRMYFWSSLQDSMTVPNIDVYWSDEDFVMPTNEFVITHSTSGGDADQQVLTIHIGHRNLKFRYIRIQMAFADSCQWIVLAEVEFCGECCDNCNDIINSVICDFSQGQQLLTISPSQQLVKMCELFLPRREQQM